jgi:hypothetical protein
MNHSPRLTVAVPVRDRLAAPSGFTNAPWYGVQPHTVPTAQRFHHTNVDAGRGPTFGLVAPGEMPGRRHTTPDEVPPICLTAS